MTDIATLGLRIDTSDVKSASGELDKLATASGRAQSASGNLQKATAGASTGAAALAKQTGLAQHELVNLSRQVQDIGVSLSSGQSPFTVLVQQGTQVGDIFANTQGSARGFGAQLLAMVTPTRVLVAGLAAVGAAAFLAATAWKTYALQLDDVARRAGLATNELSKLQAAASFKGIDSDEFFKAMERFSTQVYLAQRGMGGLADVFRANNVQAKTFNQYLEGVASLIQRATSEEQKYRILEQAGLPVTAEWVRLLSGGPEALRKATAAAAEFGGTANDQMVKKAREFDEAWQKAWTNFGRYSRSAVVDLAPIMVQAFKNIPIIGPALIAADVAKKFAGGGQPSGTKIEVGPGSIGGKPTGNAKPPVDPEVARHALALEQQRIGILGQLATVSDAVRAKEIEIAQARLNNVRITKDEEAALKNLAAVQAESAKLSQQVQFGIFDAGRQAANAQRELRSLIDQGVIKSAEDYAAAQAVIAKRIKESADAAAVARSPFEQLTRFALDGANLTKQLDTFSVSSLGNIENALVSFATGAKDAQTAFRDMATAVLADLARMIIRMQITVPLAQALNAALGAGGFGGAPLPGGAPIGQGGIGHAHGGAIVGSEATFRRYVHPAYFDRAPRYHRGGMIGPDEVPIIARQGEGVFTPAQMRALAPIGRMAYGSGSGPITVNVNNAPPDTSADVSTSRTPGGGTRIDVTLSRHIDDTTGGHIDSGQSSINRAMERRYGLTPRL